MFFANALGALWRPLWMITFLSPHPGASTWPPLTSRNISKRNVFLLILNIKGAPGPASEWSPKSKKCKIYRENACFFANAVGALWRPLWVVIFLSPHPGASRWPSLNSRNILKRNAFLTFLKMKGAPGAATRWIP